MSTDWPPLPPVTRTEVAAMLEVIEDLPTIPETLISILDVIDDPDSGPSDLAVAVRRDAPLMAKILRLANSPYYSAHGGIGDINRCVTVLGFRTVRQVAIGVQVATVLVRAVADVTGDLDYRELWRHSVVTGAIARCLARETRHPAPEEVFTAGLLHDIGKFVLEIHAPDRYAGVIAGRIARRLPLIHAEREAFGCDHATLGDAFARTWRFPAFLAAACGLHHGQDPRATDRDVALVVLADYLANTMEPPRTDLGFDPGRQDLLRLHHAAGLTLGEVEQMLPRLRDEIRLSAPFFQLT